MSEYSPGFISEYWRLCEELSVEDSALLVVGCDPSGENSNVEAWKIHERPGGYEAVKRGIIGALRKGTIKGVLVPVHEDDIDRTPPGEEPGVFNTRKTTVDVDSLRAWLLNRGFNTGFFFPTGADRPSYLDKAHVAYAPKLAAAVAAWEAVNNDPIYASNGKTVKQNLENWLQAHAAEFGLIKEDGEINKDAIEKQIAKVANWQDKGGAPKTPGG